MLSLKKRWERVLQALIDFDFGTCHPHKPDQWLAAQPTAQISLALTTAAPFLGIWNVAPLVTAAPSGEPQHGQGQAVTTS